MLQRQSGIWLKAAHARDPFVLPDDRFILMCDSYWTGMIDGA
jgi:hypothetical protein